MSVLFDFTNVADLSDSLKSRLAGGGKVNPNIAAVVGIVQAGKAAGQPLLTISMIEAVWFRMSKPAISQQAMRNALNGAVKTGAVIKPSRQTYAVAGTVVAAPEAPVAVEDATDDTTGAVETTNDPLA